MPIPVLTTVGGMFLTPGFAGQIADLSVSNVRTFINESAVALDFGVAAARGATGNAGDPPTCKPLDGDTNQLIGITVKTPLVAASTDSLNTVNYPQRSAVGVMNIGHVWVTALEQVRKGDAVLAITASGGALASSMGGVAGTGRLTVPGAIWETDTAAGAIGLVKIIGGETGRTT